MSSPPDLLSSTAKSGGGRARGREQEWKGQPELANAGRCTEKRKGCTLLEVGLVIFRSICLHLTLDVRIYYYHIVTNSEI